jgi:phage terminase large subunit
MQFTFLDPYAPLFWSDKTYYLISGGRASGKSTQVAAYFLVKLMGDEFFRGVISRYTQKSIKSSIYRDILDLAEQWGIKSMLKMDGDEIINPSNGNMIITHAMKLAEGVMTAKGKGLARVTHLLIDEATELPSEEEFIKLNDSFRTKGVERKIFIVFNPTTVRHWIHKRWYIDGKPNPKWKDDHEYIHTTYHCNSHNLDQKKIEEWERMQWMDPEYYSHHILGEWNEGLQGRIFRDWSFDYMPDPEAQIFYGLDFGFTNDPTALVEIKKRGDKIWLRELIYDTGLTNADISTLMEREGIKKTAMIVADSAEPKSIAELQRLGWRNLTGAYKGPDSVRNGISRLKTLKVHVDPKSNNLVDEYNLYAWDKTGEKPEDNNNHLMDALRYGISKMENNGSYAFYSSKQKKFDEEGLPIEKPKNSIYGYR